MLPGFCPIPHRVPNYMPFSVSFSAFEHCLEGRVRVLSVCSSDTEIFIGGNAGWLLAELLFITWLFSFSFPFNFYLKLEMIKNICRSWRIVFFSLFSTGGYQLNPNIIPTTENQEAMQLGACDFQCKGLVLYWRVGKDMWTRIASHFLFSQHCSQPQAHIADAIIVLTIINIMVLIKLTDKH